MSRVSSSTAGSGRSDARVAADRVEIRQRREPRPLRHLLRRLFRHLDQRGDRRRLAHASSVRHRQRRRGRAQATPACPSPSAKADEIHALAGGGLHREHRDDPLARRPVRGGRRGDPADVLAQRHRTSINSARGRGRLRADAVRPARADVRPLCGAAVLRPGSALAPLPRLAHRRRAPARRCSTSRRERARSRASSSRRTGCTVVGLDQSPEMLAEARRRAPAGVTLVEGRAEQLPFPDATFDALTFTYLLRYVDDPAATLHELARVVRPGGTIAGLEFALPRGPWRPLWELYVRVGLPAAGPRPLARLGRGRRRSSARASATSTARYPEGRLRELWWDAGVRDVRLTKAEPRRRDRHVGPPRVNDVARPAFYALAPGGWRDYVTLLHPPYTAWHLSYVVLGAALAPQWRPGILGLALAAFFLGMGVGAHALDELQGRPLQTRIGRTTLLVLACISLLAADRDRHRHGDRDEPVAARVRGRRRLHRGRVQPRAVRRTLPRDALVRARLGRAAGPRDVLRGGRSDPRRSGARRRSSRRSSAGCSGCSRHPCASQRAPGRTAHGGRNGSAERALAPVSASRWLRWPSPSSCSA